MGPGTGIGVPGIAAATIRACNHPPLNRRKLRHRHLLPLQTNRKGNRVPIDWPAMFRKILMSFF